MKSKKKILSTAVATVMLLGSVSAFAEAGDVVFEDSFEMTSSNGDFSVGLSEAKVYGPEIFTNGGFETLMKKTVTAEDGTTSQVDDLQNVDLDGDGTVDFACSGRYLSSPNYISTDYGRTGNGAYTEKQKTDVTSSFRVILNKEKLDRGVYELSFWVKNHTENRVALRWCENDAQSVVTAGNATSQADAVATAWSVNHKATYFPTINGKNGTAEWKKVTAYVSFTQKPAYNPSIYIMAREKDGTNAAKVYVDDFSLKKVVNCSLVNGKDVGGRLDSQTDVPYYSLEDVAGKTVSVTYPIKNNTSEEKNATLITALYDEDGRFVQVLDTTTQAIPADGNLNYIEKDIAIPADVDNTYSVKYLLWNSVDGMAPLGKVKTYSDTPYSMLGNGESIPGTKWQLLDETPGDLDQTTLPEHMDRIVTDNAATGISSLYIPNPKTIKNMSVVFRTVDLKANTKYALKVKTFNSGNQDPVKLRIQEGSPRTSENPYLNIAWVKTDGTKVTQCDHLTTDGLDETTGVRIIMGNTVARYYLHPKQWVENTFEFTTGDATKYSIEFTKSDCGYSLHSVMNACQGCYIDDVQVVELAADATE